MSSDGHMSARKLLWSYLSNRQRVQYLARGTFDVRGSAGGLYRIRRDWSGEVIDLIYGEVRQAYLVPGRADLGFCKRDNQMLALKLQIETDEGGFKMIACRRPATWNDYHWRRSRGASG